MNEPQTSVSITTKEYALTPKEYFWILLSSSFWRSWYGILFLLFAVILSWEIAVKCPEEFFLLFVKYVSLGVLLVSLFQRTYRNYRAAYHPANRPVMYKKIMTLEKDQVTTRLIDGEGYTVYKQADIYRVEELKKHYLFYITPHLFLHLAKNAFHNDEDQERFIKEILPNYRRLKRPVMLMLACCVITLALSIGFGVFLSFVEIVPNHSPNESELYLVDHF